MKPPFMSENNQSVAPDTLLVVAGNQSVVPDTLFRADEQSIRRSGYPVPRRRTTNPLLRISCSMTANNQSGVPDFPLPVCPGPAGIIPLTGIRMCSETLRQGCASSRLFLQVLSVGKKNKMPSKS